MNENQLYLEEAIRWKMKFLRKPSMAERMSKGIFLQSAVEIRLQNYKYKQCGAGQSGKHPGPLHHGSGNGRQNKRLDAQNNVKQTEKALPLFCSFDGIKLLQGQM